MNAERQMSRMGESKQAVPTATAVTADRAAFISRLQAVLRHWPSADRLARATGVSPSAFRKWLRAEAEPSRERLVALAKAAGVTVGWLASGEGPEPRLQNIPKASRGREADLPAQTVHPGIDWKSYVFLPKRPEAAAAGIESHPTDMPTEFIALRLDWIRGQLGVEPETLTIEMAQGESMQPGIEDGDLLFVDTSENKLGSFGVYVLEVASERLVKRVQPKLDGSLTLISDNPAYEPEHLPPERASGVQVIGRVIWTGGPTRRPR